MNSSSNPEQRTPGLREASGQRALVVRIGALGDVLLTRRLTFSLSRAGFRSTLLAPARHASLLLHDCWIEAVLDSESPRFAEAFAGGWPEEGGAFDLAVVISRSASLVDAARLAAARIIVVSPEPERSDRSIAQQWVAALNAECEPFPGLLPRLAVADRALRVKRATLIHPGSGSPRKNWPIERFRELSLELLTLGHAVVWIRGPAESGEVVPPAGVECLDHPSLPSLARTLAAARLFIGNDSGVSHLAAAVGAPTVALFGPTSSEIWAPDGERVRVVRSPTPAMANLLLEDVLTVAAAR
ncbi:MAG: glycosyltransferase family 9 protein [Vicinamibacteria bacterium]|nr:glycosyltransferase family 9 protein [Vicinamibacteria bacterium]